MSEGDKPKLEIYLLVSWKPLTTTMLPPHRYKSIIKRITLGNLKRINNFGGDTNTKPTMIGEFNGKMILFRDYSGQGVVTTVLSRAGI